MSDFFGTVSGDQDPVRKLLAYIPGFGGYIERENRRAADKLLRESVSRRFDELYKRLSALQSEVISNGGIEYIDEMEKAALQLRTFADKIRTATYGYSGFFDAVKINEDELNKLYQFDTAFFESADGISAALDTLEGSLGNPEALPATIRNLTSLARDAARAFEHRYDQINSAG